MRIFIAILLASLSACATFDGTPTSPLDSPAGEEILKKYTEQFLKAVSDFGVECPKVASDVDVKYQKVASDVERNTLISKALIIMDTNYAKFVNETETHRKGKDMLIDLAELSMNLAGAAVGSAGTKTILAAISAGANGINGSIDKNYFYDKAYQSLVARMNADRKMIRERILRSMATSIEKYPWHLAVNDLIEYYNAGTLFSAISSIQREAGNDEHQADEAIKTIRLDSIITEEIRLLSLKLKTALKQLSNYDAKKLSSLKTDLLPALKKDLGNIKNCNSLDASKLTTGLDVGNALLKCQQEVGDQEHRKAQEIKDGLETMEKDYINAGLLEN